MKTFKITFENQIGDGYYYNVPVESYESLNSRKGIYQDQTGKFKGYPFVKFLIDGFLDNEYCPHSFKDFGPIIKVVIEQV
jgi:hypothetical protein